MVAAGGGGARPYIGIVVAVVEGGDFHRVSTNERVVGRRAGSSLGKEISGPSWGHDRAASVVPASVGTPLDELPLPTTTGYYASTVVTTRLSFTTDCCLVPRERRIVTIAHM